MSNLLAFYNIFHIMFLHYHGQRSLEGFRKLNGTHQILLRNNDINLLDENLNTTSNNKKAID
jgi:hypothetical protein